MLFVKLNTNISICVLFVIAFMFMEWAEGQKWMRNETKPLIGETEILFKFRKHLINLIACLMLLGIIP